MSSSSQPTTVKSWVHTTTSYPATLQLTNTLIPPTPSPHHLLIHIHATSLNPVDIQLMNFPLFNLPYLSNPKHLARDFSGTILSVSPEIASDTTYSLKKGDEVCGVIPDFFGTTGGLTEVAHVDSRKVCMVRKPRHLSHKLAASLPLVWLTARTSIERVTRTLTKSPASENRLVVLGGSSATGIYTIKLAKQRGWTVLSTCSGRNTEFVKGLGADEVVDYTTSPSAVVDAVKKFKPGAIIDNVGGTDTIGLAGHYVTIVGDKTGRSTMGGSALYLTHPKMVARWFLGYMGVGNIYECIIMDATNREWLEEIEKLKEDDVVVDSVFRFERVKEAFERMDTGRCRGKVVVEVDDGK